MLFQFLPQYFYFLLLTNKKLYTNIDEYVYIELSVSGFNVKTLL